MYGAIKAINKTILFTFSFWKEKVKDDVLQALPEILSANIFQYATVSLQTGEEGTFQVEYTMKVIKTQWYTRGEEYSGTLRIARSFKRDDNWGWEVEIKGPLKGYLHHTIKRVQTEKRERAEFASSVKTWMEENKLTWKQASHLLRISTATLNSVLQGLRNVSPSRFVEIRADFKSALLSHTLLPPAVQPSTNSPGVEVEES